ncbi:triacylglycerol lipase [Dactylonectria macrodidyma]|uniref:Carboxylic ester hydrolase n=1 Tax=Dactylonectria macrodidyma TaxID=307937 RepID=A0A9P9DST2_9HYPO|nr:triacylglycerol lipase [Dactylonectria macrodidyma]
MLRCFLLYVILSLTACVPAYASSPVVDLGYAKYKGTSLPVGVDQFLSMRYARPPTGDLRFRAPMEPNNETSTKSATKFGKICIGLGQTPSSSIGEDCLFVNVFKPSHATETSKLPVWVYIQGGGYRGNANNNYNGTKVIVESDFNLIFVNFNYRVGPLGFLASDKVVEDGALNIGLLDQRRLLWWVQEHIEQFGGDPDHVVIHGASAGGGSVSHHMTAYGGRDDNLFIGAGLQSPFWPTQRTVAESEFQFERLVEATNCTEQDHALECLRDIPVADLIAAANVTPYPGASDLPLPHFYWLPVIDGDFIQDHLFSLFDQGKFVNLPSLVTHTTNEGSNYGYNANNTSEVLVFLRNNYPKLTSDNLDDISELYPLDDPLPKHNAYFPSASAAYGDRTFICGGNQAAASIAQHLSPTHVWNYRFNVQDPSSVAAGLGVPHAFDMTAILGVGYAGSAASSYKTTNAAIIPATMHYWISFVRALNPNTYRLSGTPLWEAWGTGTGKRLKLETNNTAMESVPSLSSERCALWKAIVNSA